jgi:hypothetical protein
MDPSSDPAARYLGTSNLNTFSFDLMQFMISKDVITGLKDDNFSVIRSLKSIFLVPSSFAALNRFEGKDRTLL